MANIIKFEKGVSYHSSAKSGKPVDVICIYDIQKLLDNSKCIVLKTYNPNSEKAGISQTIHLTKNTAKKLIKILIDEFEF